MPDATAAAEPPLDPLVERPVSHGLRTGPNSTGSQAGAIPNSGVLVLPRMTRPARRSRSTSSESKADTLPARKREPSVKRTPSISQARSLTRYGTPAKGPAGPARACSAARSKTGVTTAFSSGFSGHGLTSSWPGLQHDVERRRLLGDAPHPGVAGLGEHLAEPGLAGHRPERRRAGLGERGGRAHQRRDGVADAGVGVGEVVLEAVGGERLDDHRRPAG